MVTIRKGRDTINTINYLKLVPNGTIIYVGQYICFRFSWSPLFTLSMEIRLRQKFFKVVNYILRMVLPDDVLTVCHLWGWSGNGHFIDLAKPPMTTVHRSISLQEGQQAYFLKLSAVFPIPAWAADTVLGSWAATSLRGCEDINWPCYKCKKNW